MTNRHVCVQTSKKEPGKWRIAHANDITIVFRYDDAPRSQVSDAYKLRASGYRYIGRENLSQHDYAILTLFPSTGFDMRLLHQLMINPFRFEETDRVRVLFDGTERRFALIGHPQGGPKTLSFLNITSLTFDDQNNVEYDTSCSRPGNSGGPVLFVGDADKNIANPTRVMFFHVGSGKGVYCKSALETIRINTQP